MHYSHFFFAQRGLVGDLMKCRESFYTPQRPTKLIHFNKVWGQKVSGTICEWLTPTAVSHITDRSHSNLSKETQACFCEFHKRCSVQQRCVIWLKIFGSDVGRATTNKLYVYRYLSGYLPISFSHANKSTCAKVPGIKFYFAISIVTKITNWWTFPDLPLTLHRMTFVVLTEVSDPDTSKPVAMIIDV